MKTAIVCLSAAEAAKTYVQPNVQATAYAKGEKVELHGGLCEWECKVPNWCNGIISGTPEPYPEKYYLPGGEFHAEAWTMTKGMSDDICSSRPVNFTGSVVVYKKPATGAKTSYQAGDRVHVEFESDGLTLTKCEYDCINSNWCNAFPAENYFLPDGIHKGKAWQEVKCEELVAIDESIDEPAIEELEKPVSDMPMYVQPSAAQPTNYQVGDIVQLHNNACQYKCKVANWANGMEDKNGNLHPSAYPEKYFLPDGLYYGLAWELIAFPADNEDLCKTRPEDFRATIAYVKPTDATTNYKFGDRVEVVDLSIKCEYDCINSNWCNASTAANYLLPNGEHKEQAWKEVRCTPIVIETPEMPKCLAANCLVCEDGELQKCKTCLPKFKLNDCGECLSDVSLRGAL